MLSRHVACFSVADLCFTTCRPRKISHLKKRQSLGPFPSNYDIPIIMKTCTKFLLRIFKGHVALFPLLTCVSRAADFVESYIHLCVDRRL